MTTQPVKIDLTPEALEAINVANQLVEKGATVKIENQEQLEKATTLRSWVSTHLNKLEEIKLAVTKPFRDAVAETNALFKGQTDPLSKTKAAISSAMIVYNDKQEQIRRQEERVRQAAEDEARKKREADALAEAEKLQAEGRTEEAERVIETAASAPEPLPIAVAVPKGPVRGVMGGSASFKKVWDFELDPKLDPEEAIKLVPSHFLVPPLERLDGKVIRAKITQGTEDKPVSIPGLRIFQKSSVSGR